jgi:protein TonB
LQNTDTVTNTPSEGTGMGLKSYIHAGNGTATSPPVDLGNTIVSSVTLTNSKFPGGIAKFYNYVGNNFEKQEIDGSGSIRVYVSFVIERDGSMTDIQVKEIRKRP